MNYEEEYYQVENNSFGYAQHLQRCYPFLYQYPGLGNRNSYRVAGGAYHPTTGTP